MEQRVIDEIYNIIRKHCPYHTQVQVIVTPMTITVSEQLPVKTVTGGNQPDTGRVKIELQAMADVADSIATGMVDSPQKVAEYLRTIILALKDKL